MPHDILMEIVSKYPTCFTLMVNKLTYTQLSNKYESLLYIELPDRRVSIIVGNEIKDNDVIVCLKEKLT